MTKEIERTYSEAQEAAIMAAATENGGFINMNVAARLAEEIGKGAKSVIAKATRMGVYKAKEKTSKAGGKVESKENIVADIAALVNKNMEGLENAPKLVLQNIRAALSA